MKKWKRGRKANKEYALELREIAAKERSLCVAYCWRENPFSDELKSATLSPMQIAG